MSSRSIVFYIIIFILSFFILYLRFPNFSVSFYFYVSLLITGYIATGLNRRRGFIRGDHLINDGLFNIDNPLDVPQVEVQASREQNRLEALNRVKLFLSPFKSIWNDIRVSNNFCTLKLLKDGKTICITEKVDETKETYKYLVLSDALESTWDNLCMFFLHDTTYEKLVHLCEVMDLKYKETILKNSQYERKKLFQREKVDINNCSEVEMTALPGISIVYSKKAIKKREEINGFKNIDDFFDFLKIKPRMREQLRDKICVKEMKGNTQVYKSVERTVDL